MSLSNLEVLLNAQMNFETVAEMVPGLGGNLIFAMAIEQLKNGIAALEAGQSPDDTFIE